MITIIIERIRHNGHIILKSDDHEKRTYIDMSMAEAKRLYRDEFDIKRAEYLDINPKTLNDIPVGCKFRIGKKRFIRVDSGGVIDDAVDADGVKHIEGLYVKGHALLVDLKTGILHRKKLYTPCK